MLNAIRKKMVNGFMLVLLWVIDLELKNKHLDGKSKAALIGHRDELEKALSVQRRRT